MSFCTPENNIPDINDNDNSDYVVTEEYFSDDSDNVELIEFNTETGIVKYRILGEAPKINIGDTLIINNDKGHLRNVDSISYEKDILTMETSFAYMSDLFKEASVEIDSSNVHTENKSGKGYGYHDLNLNFSHDLSGTNLYDNNGVSVDITSGSISFQPVVVVAFNLEGNNLTYFQSYAQGTVTFDATLQVQASRSIEESHEVKLFEHSHTFKHVIPGTPVPIWEDVTGSFFVGFDLDSSITGTAQTNVHASSTVKIGGKWQNNQWQNVNNSPTLTTSINDPSVSVEGELNLDVYVKPQIDISLYSVATMGVTLKPYGRYNLDSTASWDPDNGTRYAYWWKMLAGLSSDLIVDLTVFGQNLYTNTIPIFDFNQLVDGGGSTVQDLEITAVGSQIDLEWKSHLDANYYNIYWKKSGDPYYQKINSCFYYNEYTHTNLQPGNRYYFKITASRYWDGHNVENNPDYAGINYKKQIFSDVPVSHWAYDCINNLYERGIIAGYPDGTYHPNDSVDRKATAVLTIKSKYGDNFSYSQTPHFYDVPSSHWAFPYIQEMYERNIYRSSYYYPDSNATRAVISEFIAKSLYGDSFSYNTSPYFSDVSYTHPQFKYIQKLRQEGIISGFPDGTFKPSNTVTRAQVAAFMWSAFFK